MADQQTPVPQPAQQQGDATSQQQQSSTRGRGRGRGRGYSSRNADRARSDINRSGAPVQLDGKFLGFSERERGNAKVTINHQVTEIASNDMKQVIRTNQASKGFFNQQGQPYDLDYLSNGLAGGLCLSIALKLIQATPNGQIPQISTFRSFKEFQIQVPRNFLQIIDIIGKTTYQDWIIRIKHNGLLIKRMLLKSIKYLKQNPDYMQDYVFLHDEPDGGRQYLTEFNRLDQLTFDQIGDVYFNDKDSVDEIKARALDWLEPQLTHRFPVQIGNNQVMFSNPNLPTERSFVNILAWLQMFDRTIHYDAVNVMRAGTLLLMDQRWLENPRTRMDAIDARFQNTAVAAQTPTDLLTACGLRHYDQYLSEAHFIQLSRSAFTYYETTITLRLKSIFHMIVQAPSSLGSPAQLVLCPRDLLIDKTGYSDIDPNLNHCISYVKLEVSHAIIKSAMVNLVKEVDLDPDYEGHFSNALVSIRRSFFSQDGIVFSQQRMYT